MSTIDVIRKLIRQGTVNIGVPVRNLHGAIAGQSPALLIEQDSTWLVAKMPGNKLFSLQEFYAVFSNAMTKEYTVSKATQGVVVVTGIANSGSSTCCLLRGVVDLAGPTVFPLNIVSQGSTSEFAIYVDGVLQRNGTGELTHTLNLDGGRHLIEIVAVTSQLGVGVPANQRVFYDLDVLAAPIWNDISSTYVDPSTGLIGVVLQWYNDSRVGGWIVYRRVTTDLGSISTLGTLDTNRQFLVEIDGDYSSDIQIGSTLQAGPNEMGTVLSVGYDSVTDLTTVRMILAAEHVDVDSFWLDTTARIGNFVEQTRISRNSIVGIVEWTDAAVTIAQTYDYILQSYGLFDNTQLSPFSEIRSITAGDFEAPSSIVFDFGYPLVYNNVATVKFTTPVDTDYDGVRVYFKEVPATGTSSGAAAIDSLVLTDTSQNWATRSFAGYKVLITGGTGQGQILDIQSNTANTLTLVSGFTVAIDATSTYEIYRLIPVITDYGVPNVSDEFQFTLVGEGTYYFMSFDRGGNLQDQFSAASWDFDATDSLSIPITQYAITDRTETGQAVNTIMGISLYTVPAATPEFADEFSEIDGSRFLTLHSGTSDSSGGSVSTLVDSGQGWTTNQFTNKWLRITQIGANYGLRARIASNTTDTLTFSPHLPIAPDSSSYIIIDHCEDRVVAATDVWVPLDTTTVLIIGDKALFVGANSKLWTMYVDAARNGKTTPFRYEAVINRGGIGHYSGASTHTGSSLTYRGNPTNTLRWEFGILHSSDSTVAIRYRYNSGGTGNWNNLYSGYAWLNDTAKKLIVELDGDIHTFKIADAYGHDEVVLGRITGTAGPTGTKFGWAVRGNSGDDWLDNAKVFDYNDLARIKYSVSPDDDQLRKIQWSGTANSGSTTMLNDLKQVWRTDELKGLRVLITAGTGAGSDRLIQTNTSNSIVPDTPFSAAITSNSVYIVYDIQYLGTESLQFWRTKNATNPQTMIFHGEREGVPDELERRVLIDPNTIPEMTISVTKTAGGASTGDLTVKIFPDDDVKTWMLYARKSNWPTTDNTSTGSPDRLYIKENGMIPVNSTTITLQVGTGVWYVVAVPYDSNGNAGPQVSGFVDISSGGGGLSTALTNVFVGKVGNVYRIYWSHTADVEAPATTGTVRVFVYNSVTGPGSQIELSEANRYVHTDASGVVTGMGSIDDTNITFGTKGVDPYVTFYYTVKLYVSGSLVNSYYTQASGYVRGAA